MSKLIYDPQARLYSTISAYGKTWELTRIESDGTQHWQSGKQSAILQKMVERDTEGRYAEETGYVAYKQPEDANSKWVFDGTVSLDIESLAKTYGLGRGLLQSPPPAMLDHQAALANADTHPKYTLGVPVRVGHESGKPITIKRIY